MTAATLPRFAHGTTVTATYPITGHAITGRWNANTAYLEFDSGNGHHRIPLEQLDGCTFTSTEAKTA